MSKFIKNKKLYLIIYSIIFIFFVESNKLYGDENTDQVLDQIFSSETQKKLFSIQQQRKLDFMMISTAESGLGTTIWAISHFFNTPFNPERIRMEEIRQQIMDLQKVETAEDIFDKISRFKSDQRNFEFVPGAKPGSFETDMRYEAKTTLADLEAQLYKARSDEFTKDGIKKKIGFLNQELQHVAERGLLSSGLRQLAKVTKFIAWTDGIMVVVDIIGAGVMTFLLDIDPLPFIAVRSGHKFLSPLPKNFYETAIKLYTELKN